MWMVLPTATASAAVIDDWLLLLPGDAADAIRAGGRFGEFTCTVGRGEDLAAVRQVRSENGPLMPVGLSKLHWLASAEERPAGRWYRVSPELHGLWWHLRARPGTAMKFDDFAAHVTGLYNGPHLAVTYAPDIPEAFRAVGVPEMLGWQVSRDGVTPINIETQPDTLGVGQLSPGWPVKALGDTSVMIVGAGSIGGAAAVDLATYGVGQLTLVDPGRLRWHNLIRHVGSARDVGRPKVSALAGQIQALRPDTTVATHMLNVVTDADQIRALLPGTDVVLCAADGVAARRVVSHLARRAGVDAVLACVLGDGEMGELLRLRPWPRHGCLLCHRAMLIETGAIDPEPTLDAPYGQGTRHRPMTAVGADLHLVGNLAAKAAVATVLERRGNADQRLPGEHAVIGLRPEPGRPAPFDVTAAGQIRWSGSWPSRPNCPTCTPP
jgi:molybdopterin-synthase adenylyltransferase